MAATRTVSALRRTQSARSGSLGSGSVSTIVYGALLINTGSGPITDLTISYAGEMLRRGTAASDLLTFSYSTDASNITTGTFTNVAALNFAPALAQTLRPLAASTPNGRRSPSW